MAFDAEAGGDPFHGIGLVLVWVTDVDDVADFHREAVGEGGFGKVFGGLGGEAAVGRFTEDERDRE